MLKSYQELCKLPTFEARYQYLRLSSAVGQETFGFDRYLNQAIYQSREWKRVRREMILRDQGCDLGIEGREIHHGLVLHHINPLVVEDMLERAEFVLDPENLICTSASTHRAIHFGDASLLVSLPPPRRKGDTRLW